MYLANNFFLILFNFLGFSFISVILLGSDFAFVIILEKADFAETIGVVRLIIMATFLSSLSVSDVEVAGITHIP